MKLYPSSKDFPNLFGEMTWGPLRCAFEMRDSAPPAELVGNVNCVPFVGEGCLVLLLRNGKTEIPGGTLEPGEAYEQAIRRELFEEAGARLASFAVLGAWRCRSSEPAPYRPHLPHPESYRVVVYGEASMAGEPRKGAGFEDVAAVERVSVEEAARKFESIGRPELADLYRLAAAVRAARAAGE
jgi:8-oxo-dGTP diphosphatase